MIAKAPKSSRETILGKIRAALPQSSPLPELESTGPWQTFEDKETRFGEVLKFVGGLPFGFGWFMAAFNREGRSLHDVLAETSVVFRVTSSTLLR